jgi:hypothetical protein
MECEWLSAMELFSLVLSWWLPPSPPTCLFRPAQRPLVNCSGVYNKEILIGMGTLKKFTLLPSLLKVQHSTLEKIVYLVPSPCRAHQCFY